MSAVAEIPQAAPAPAPARTAAPWVVSAPFDLLFFVASSLVVLGPYVATQIYRVPSIWVLGAVGILSNGPHLASTWSRVYLDGNERWRRPIHYFLIPALIAAGVCGIVAYEGRRSSVLFTIVFYWAFWHFVSQNWGIVRIYQRKQGDVEGWDARLERVVLWLGALAPLFWRLAHGPTRMFGARVFHPDVPDWVPTIVWALAAAVGSLYLARFVVRWREGRPIAWVRPLFLASCAFGFFVPFVLITRNGSAAFSAAAAWHGLQYVGIVWHFNRSRWKDGVDAKTRMISWISQPGRAVAYYVVMVALVSLAFGAIQVLSLIALDVKTWGVLIWNSTTLGHYWLDGVIWKLRKPDVARHLV